jgi:alkaline phosphatase D
MKRAWLFVVVVLMLSAFTSVAQAKNNGDDDDGDDSNGPPPTFTHGVASGDVLSGKAIVWTRVNKASILRVEVSRNATFTAVDFRRTVQATAANDFTAKVDASNLRPGNQYFYRWIASAPEGDDDDDDDDGEQELDCPCSTSPVGRFETAPLVTVPATARFGYTADSDGTRTNRPPSHKSFEVLDRLREENPQFWAYIGDTIYSDSSLRATGPATTLPEYRAAYKVNRTYPALRNLLRSTSTYTIWDDHEVVNDFDGRTVDPARYRAGREAFLEYMPIRTSNLLHDPTCAGDPLFRKFRWGSSIDIIIPDERSCRSGDVAQNPCQGDLAPTLPSAIRVGAGLPPNPPPGCLAAINDPSRTVLGPVQKQAFKNALRSTAKFKIVINEYPIQQFWALPYDRWEGYAAERREIIRFIRNNNIRNVLFLTTDTHATLINQVFVDRFDEPEPVFDEAVTGPISTFTFEEEVVDFGGPGALSGVNLAFNIAGEDCRQLDQFSYGSVSAVPASATPAIAFRDDTGAPIMNQGPTGGPICVYPAVPPVP